MDSTRRLPPALVEHAREFLAGGRTPVVPKGAATVVLPRPTEGYDDRPQVYLLRRHLGMAFAAGTYAFPGGTVDPRDSDQAVAWAGPSPAEWANRLDCDEAEARALVCAAVRETFEESGVLLAGATADEVVDDTTGEEWERDRAALVDRSLALADLLRARGLVLRTDLLVAWAHWITPEFEPRRYDTRFSVAALPEGQRTRDVSGEADTVAWMSAADATAGVDSGQMLMLPPTYITLRELVGFTSVTDVVGAAAERHIVTVVPGVEIVDGEGMLTLPPGRGAVTGWEGGSFGAHAQCMLAPNAGPMTLDGTNTWVLRAEDSGRAVVVDPGPLDAGHLDAVADVAGEVTAVLLTHGHADHSEGARAFADRVGCGVRALDPTFVYGDLGLHDGDVVEVDGLEIRVVGTPGHTSDSLSFVVAEDRAVLTGDTVLGRGTTVVAHPDGKLGAYLGSLQRLRDLAEAHEVETIWPGHGPVLDDALAAIEQYLAHRAERLDQIRDALAQGAIEPIDVVRTVYADVDQRLWPAAELSVRAQLDYLRGAG